MLRQTKHSIEYFIGQTDSQINTASKQIWNFKTDLLMAKLCFALLGVCCLGIGICELLGFIGFA
jgi:hypothetical protein